MAQALASQTNARAEHTLLTSCLTGAEYLDWEMQHDPAHVAWQDDVPGLYSIQ